MSTELPEFRKLNVKPETDEELRARFNSNTNTDETEQDINNAAGNTDANYEEQLTQENKGKSTRSRIMGKFGIILGSTLGVGALAMGAANVLGNAKTEKDPAAQPEETNSANLVPGAIETTAPAAEATPSPFSSPANTEALNTAQPVIDTLPTDVIESGLFEGLSSEKQAEIKSLDSMTVEQFRDQPLEKQLMFAQFAYDNNAPRVLKKMRNLGFDMEEYANRITTPSKESTPQEVTDRVSIVLDVAGSLYSADDTYDVDTARKMISLSLNPSTLAYAKYDEYLQNRPTGLSMATTTDINAAKTFESGNGTQMKINAISPEGKDVQTTFEHIQFTDVQGQEQSTWRSVLSVPSSDSRYDTSVN